MRLKIPKNQVDKISFAYVAAHEMAHTRGVKHRAMAEAPSPESTLPFAMML
jgi:hypothetical protein